MPKSFERPSIPTPEDKKPGEGDKEKKIPRRKFLAGIGAAFTADYTAGKAAEYAGSRREKREGANIVHVEGKMGSYKVVHSDHHIPNAPETTEGTDALMLEQQMIFSERGARMYMDFRETSDDPEIAQYKAILQEAQQKHIPVFFVDMSMFTKSQEIENEKLRRNILRQVEEVLGVSLVGYQAAELANKKKMSRREFLTHGIKSTVATYLLLPRAEQLAGRAATGRGAQEVDEDSVSRKTERALRDINETVHPEINMPLTLHLRNAVMAQKSETVSGILAQELGRRPTSALYVGSNHTGVERELQGTSDGRMKRIANYLDESDMQANGKIVRLDFVSQEDGSQTVDVSILEDEAFLNERK